MRKYIFFFDLTLAILLLAFRIGSRPFNSSLAATPADFNPPSQITLEMFALTGNGAKDPSYDPPECAQTAETSLAYGCTFYDGSYEESSPGLGDGLEKVYPFGETYTITIGYESHSVAGEPGVEFGYIHNVISQEMTEGSPLTAYTAQAIAARTYAYTQTLGGQVAINNTGSSYQVYIPYRYDGLGEGLGDAIKIQRRTLVDEAVTTAGPLYITYLETSPPIKAHFGMDNCTYTEEGAYPYLVSIYDPISAKPDPCDNSDSSNGTGYGGMGSMGAARWAYGNLSPYGISNDWSVQWRAVEQILTHYYTQIHIRNAAGERLTPEYRWVPLQIDWHTADNAIPIMEPGTIYSVTFKIQNTGVITWPGNDQVMFKHHGWELSDGQLALSAAVGPQAVALTDPVPPGETVDVELNLYPSPPPQPGTAYTMRFEMWQWVTEGAGDWVGFSEVEPGYPWPTYDVMLCVGGPCQEQVFLPLVNHEMGATR
jgi:hypothetical protein